MVGILISTLFTVLTWQFAQFVLLLEGFALFGAWSLDILSKRKVCQLDFGNVNYEIFQNIVSCWCCCCGGTVISVVSLLLWMSYHFMSSRPHFSGAKNNDRGEVTSGLIHERRA